MEKISRKPCKMGVFGQAVGGQSPIRLKSTLISRDTPTWRLV